MSDKPLVSVVVPTRNSEGSLRRCLESIVRQDDAAVELIVVDNHSRDRTLEIARAFTSRVLTRGPERSAQRNAGARTATGSFLVFIDSDMVLDRRVVGQCVEAAGANPALQGIIIPERSVGSGYWARCKALERGCYVGDDTIEAARFFRRPAFDAVGGYDETLTAAEDWDLSQRVREIGSVGRIDAYITHLEGRLTLRKTMRSKYYYGTTLGRYIRKQPATAARQLRIIRPAFIRHRRRLLAHPVLTAGMVVLKGAEFAAGGAGLVVMSWRQRRRP